ncbi:hypothetical protein CG747_12475 [Streptomyces sp. CB02959]|uniref:hypothetical protein n=1 Tax=Streptomyces sp. CB02959 TaxID=2020330 RepID=UPI000C2727D3|nr:hypothetical protein [Streptomyces sp. CB02959]PJN40483.1 hypothetical protein CG747_12475 [Streptomyces sp. CB02959]
MTHRYMPVFVFTLLVVGLSAGVVGLLGGDDDFFSAGLFLTLTAVPLIITRTVHNSHTVTAHQLAEADRAGYHRALDHVARGLLDAPAPPDPGHRATAEQVAGNVITLRPRPTRPIERKAQ